MENEQKAWELWLHKVFDKSYAEFSEELKRDRDMRRNAMHMERVDIKKATDVAMNTLGLLGGDAS